MNSIAAGTLAYIETLRVPGTPVLYASTYAAMTRHLYGELDALGQRERAEWVAYLQSYQDDDGLFRDPAIYDQGWYAGDPEWCGRRHLSCHVIIALTCLGDVSHLVPHPLAGAAGTDAARFVSGRDRLALLRVPGDAVLARRTHIIRRQPDATDD